MSEPTTAKVIPWRPGPQRAEYVDIDGIRWLKPIAPVRGQAVLEAEASGKVRFFSDQVRKYWQRASQVA